MLVLYIDNYSGKYSLIKTPKIIKSGNDALIKSFKQIIKKNDMVHIETYHSNENGYDTLMVYICMDKSSLQEAVDYYTNYNLRPIELI